MQANLDTAAKTLTIQYEDDIDLLILWAYLDINRADMIKAPKSADLTAENEAALNAKSLGFFGSTFPVWDTLYEALLASGIIVRP